MDIMENQEVSAGDCLKTAFKRARNVLNSIQN